ncbi:MAG: SMI1/KNR4 family protein [Alphaproteobacteria bacterium]|nr:SMI1/KNR4 family protein [Alphaproteobacteria bacterium]
MGGHRFLPLEEARAEKRAMDQLALDEGWEASWWSPDWHPFASDFAGQLLVVDAPTGRVLEFLHDDEARPEIAPDLDRLIERIWTALHAGTHVYDPQFGIGTPDEIAAYHAARASYAHRAPKGSARPNLALVLMLIPTFGVLALGMALDLGPGPTSIAAGGVALILTGVFWRIGWIEF